MTQGFAHALPIDSIRDDMRLELTADDAERDAIAKRLGLECLARLEAHATLTRSGETVRARGRLVAALDQSCVITNDPVSSHVDEAFEVLFVPEPAGTCPDEEIELDEADCDTCFHDGSTIDLGSAIADSLALALDPYPRSAAADAALKDAGVMSESEAGPFAALAKLKGRDEP